MLQAARHARHTVTRSARLAQQRPAARAFCSVPEAAADPAPEAPARKFDPHSILPHEYGDVRILNNTTRDAQQSNCSASVLARAL